MAADDLINYNGISMRRYYAESLQMAQRRTSYRVGDRIVPRISFGGETYPMVTPGDGLCPCKCHHFLNFLQWLCNSGPVTALLLTLSGNRIWATIADAAQAAHT